MILLAQVVVNSSNKGTKIQIVEEEHWKKVILGQL